jgi:dipeptidyl aminopeptidase/acylaminoacyl peptidase
MYGDTSEVPVSPFSADQYSPLLLASRGYAVLFPSMPLAPRGAKSDPMIDIPKGVMPAIDRAIEVGIADSDRVGVMGASYGGYATYALVTNTRRFKAAVSWAGLTNLVSLYGIIPANYRAGPDAHVPLAAPEQAESGQERMGAPPWDDLWRYLKNSPIYYVDRIETPILMIHGDVDIVPIEQDEELFTSLFRLRKRARLVRYWGEWHAIESPANIRDMWTRVFDWFDHYLVATGH